MADGEAGHPAPRREDAAAATNGGGAGGTTTTGRGIAKTGTGWRPSKPLRRVMTEVGQPVMLAVETFRTLLRHRRGLLADVRDDMFDQFKKVAVPGFFAMFGYGMLLVTFSVSILLILGAANRLGTIYLAIVIREITPFIAGTVVAGVVGTATTTEIGARKIREEIDALRVLGQDPIRILVLPRVIGLAIVSWVVNTLGIIVIVIQGYVIVTILGGTSRAAYLTNFMQNLTVPELVGNFVKMILIGLLIGFICASKGMHTDSGSEGLGRAVNQAVVISVLAVFILSVLFNMVLLGSVPQITVSR
ncbi:MlaE family ABC transporter permease [Haloechinothrix salitolerans]|uniref:MlaE family ABC transporter permease n=2 Tax=Haloechinothrix salitolerans TaxID=926830 RepID=A0ABW2BWG5_9PSEU